MDYINKELIRQGNIYFNNDFPSSISKAIYEYGSYDIKEIIAYISLDEEGTRGMIITGNDIYFNFATKGHIAYQDIIKLTHDIKEQKITIKTNTATYLFRDKYLNIEQFINYLSYKTDLMVDLVMSDNEKIHHYLNIIINDIFNDEYEDINLDFNQVTKLQEIQKEVLAVNPNNIDIYQDDLERVLNDALFFFDELEIGSDEIDVLLSIQEAVNKRYEAQQQKIEEAQQYYQKMMDDYAAGNTQMYDQLQETMKSLGINEDELKDKSPEEIDAYLETLCQRFGISKSQMEALKDKFQ